MIRVVLLLLCALPAVAWSEGLTVTVSGFASSQDGISGRAALRARALDSAEDEALRRAGVDVSQKQNERRQEFFKDEEESWDRSYDRVTRATGRYVVRLLKILEENPSEKEYALRAVYEVTPESEVPVNLGFIWKNAGNPGIFLSLEEIQNGRATNGKNRMHDYLRDSLTRQGVSLLNKKTADSFRIHVSQSTEVEQNNVASVSVHTARCRAGFSIQAPLDKEVAVQRYSRGQVPGFSFTAAVESCYKELAPQLAENIIRSLDAIMRDIWKNGRTFRVIIRQVSADGEHVIKNVMRHNIDGDPPRFIGYNNGDMFWEAVFDGGGEALSAMLASLLRTGGTPVELVQIQESTIVFIYGK